MLSLRFLLAAVAGTFVATATALALLAGGAERGTTAAPVAARANVALRPGEPSGERIAALQAAVRAQPKRADGYTLLARAYLQRARETADPSFYARADRAVAQALSLSPRDAGALTQRGALRLARHDFRDGLADARRARRLAPAVTEPFGVLVDALVELGRYPEAERALQAMVDRRPDLAALARVSYFRELRGDLDGAVDAMRAAASAGGEMPENGAYVQTLLGGLELQRGRTTAALRAYGTALAQLPGYVPAEAGLARVDVARGRLPSAISRLRRVVERLPLPEHLVALGEAELAAGRRAEARRDLAVVRAQQRLLTTSGVNTDVEAALFEADHGSPARAVVLARRAWAAAPGVRSADALGWALTRAGRARQGLPWARRALALGSRDPSFLFHAGMTAKAAGDRTAARRWLRAAIARQPRFSALHGPRAARALKELA